MITEFRLYEQFNNISYRLGKESDLKDIKKITNQLRDELGFVMNVALIDAMKYDELMVAESDGVVIGFVHFHERRDGWNTIHEIGVRKDFQSMGIGKALFEMVPKPRRLKTTQDNIKSNEFYKRRGMNMTGTEKGRKREINVWADVRENADNSELDPYGEENWEDKQYEIEVIYLHDKIADNKQDAFWYYGEAIAELKKGENWVTVYPTGDIRIRFEENGKYYYNRDAVVKATELGWTDQDLADCMWMTDNNWFDFEINGVDGAEGPDGVSYEYDEAIESARTILEEL